MTIEDRVRRVLTEAVANEPPPRGAPLQVAVRDRGRPLPTTDPTAGWTLYTDAARNLQLRYPPDWVLREREPGWVRIAPPDQAASVRFASGRAYTFTEDSIERDPPPDVEVHRSRTYTIDWGRNCATGGATPGCRTQVVQAGMVAATVANDVKRLREPIKSTHRWIGWLRLRHQRIAKQLA